MNEEVSAYIDTVSDERKPMYEKLQSLVVEMYPDVRIVMTSQIPTYRAKSGWIGLGYSERGVSLYTNGPQHLADFRKTHPDIKAGKNSVEFSRSADVPEAAVKKIIQSAMEEQVKTRGRSRS